MDIKRKQQLKIFYKIGDIIFVKKKKIIGKLNNIQKLMVAFVLDAFSGDVLALVGGFNFKTSEFNRATQAKRQPGSAFKPIVYAAALENGFAPNSIILDAPFVESQGAGLKIGNQKIMVKNFMDPQLLEKE